MNFSRFLVLLGVIAVVGCGPSAQLTGSAQEETPTDIAKATLEQIVESGQAGSEIGAMMVAFEEMRATDAATADALIEDGNAMMAMSSPDEIKAKAKEMLAKLGGEAAPAADPAAESE